MRDDNFTMSASVIALVCHEANRAWCLANGDHSQRLWHEAEQWQRDSAVAGVEFALANPDATPEDQHDAWCRDKMRDGWTHGETKDAVAKTHPCLVPYGDLPEAQRVKDRIFVAIVRAMTRAE